MRPLAVVRSAGLEEGEKRCNYFLLSVLSLSHNQLILGPYNLSPYNQFCSTDDYITTSNVRTPLVANRRIIRHFIQIIL